MLYLWGPHRVLSAQSSLNGCGVLSCSPLDDAQSTVHRKNPGVSQSAEAVGISGGGRKEHILWWRGGLPGLMTSSSGCTLSCCSRLADASFSFLCNMR